MDSAKGDVLNTRSRPGRSLRGRAWVRWLGGWLLAGFLIVTASCGGLIRKRASEKTPLAKRETASAEQANDAQLRLALSDLRRGDYGTAEEILAGMIDRQEAEGMAAEVGFYLGLTKLLAMEDWKDLGRAHEYFRRYARLHPNGPHRANAERIVRLLGRYIEGYRAIEDRVRALDQKLKEQERIIETLQYQIRKLEEIQQEAEQRRKLLDVQ